jgi:hypothetical protein
LTYTGPQVSMVDTRSRNLRLKQWSMGNQRWKKLTKNWRKYFHFDAKYNNSCTKNMPFNFKGIAIFLKSKMWSKLPNIILCPILNPSIDPQLWSSFVAANAVFVELGLRIDWLPDLLESFHLEGQRSRDDQGRD